MRQRSDLQLAGMENARQFMTPEQYRDFCERFAAEVKPELDRLAEARMASEEAARHHPVF